MIVRINGERIEEVQKIEVVKTDFTSLDAALVVAAIILVAAGCGLI
jgi:hypothetical protein